MGMRLLLNKNEDQIKLMKNKKAEMENLIRVLLWIVFFALIIAGIYFTIKKLGI